MVLLKVKDNGVILKRMGEFRMAKKFTDIEISIGEQCFDAHKCVLGAGSDYFNAMLAGAFTECKKSVIDLSEVTNDIVSFEAVLNFLYFGEINIDSNNLAEVVKLASYLLIPQLQDVCTQYMLKTIDINTSLKYLFLSVDSCLHAVQKKIGALVKSRFHDYIIYKEATLGLLGKELVYLLENGYLEHCSVSKLLCFLADWVVMDISESSISFGIEFLDYLNQQTITGNLPNTSEYDITVQTVFDTKIAHLEGQLGSSDLLEKFKTLSARLSDVSYVDTKGCKYYKGNRQPEMFPAISSERVLLSISPRSWLVEDDELDQSEGRKQDQSEGRKQDQSEGRKQDQSEGRKQDQSEGRKQDQSEGRKQVLGIFHDEKVFEICMYIPRTGTWLHLNTLENLRIINKVEYCWQARCLGNMLCTASAHDITMYNLHNFTHKDLEPFRNMDYFRLTAIEKISQYDREFVYSGDKFVYMIYKIYILDANNATYFKVFKLNDEEETWDFKFNTPLFIAPQRHGFSSCCIISTSNEMLITIWAPDEGDFQKLSLSFAIDLNVDEMVVTQIYPTERQEPTASTFPKGTRVFIIEGKDSLFGILLDQSCTHEIKIKCLFQYKFHSNELLPCKDNDIIFEDYSGQEEDSSYPCCYYSYTEDSQSIWFFHGNRGFTNRLSEVKVDDNGKLIVLHHTPPPFPWVTQLVAGSVSLDVINNLKPIQKYMMTDLDL